MTPSLLVVLLAFTTLIVVAAALCREVVVLRSRKRRDLDRYLQWLLEDACGPIGLSRPLRWY